MPYKDNSFTNNTNGISAAKAADIPSSSDKPIKHNSDSVKTHSFKRIPFYLRAFFILCTFSLICLVLLFIYRINPYFSEFTVRYIGGPLRMCLGAVTSVIPFSLAESIFMLLLPCAIILPLIIKPSKKVIVSLLSVVLILFDIFALTVAPSYYRLPLHENLGIENKPVTAERLKTTCAMLVEMLNETASEIYYSFDGSSYSRQNFSELSDEIQKCYGLFCKKYDFVFPVGFRAKPIALSVPMTYLHTSGVYTYFTGEANINVNYPDYIIPHTVAHEMSHARGVFKEGDANFVGFLVCLESNDPYIRYSGIMNIFPYVANALYIADAVSYSEVMLGLNYSIYEEIDSFSKFFEKYSASKAAVVSEAVNDTYLKANGQKEGTNSYGLVVDLSVNYLEEHYDLYGLQN